MNAIEKAVTWAVNVANANRAGYSQVNRWGNPDYDCSSFVISAWEQAGVPVKTKGATYTGNMYSVFRSCGFVDVTAQVNLSNGNGLKRGDVLLHHANHTAMVTNTGRVVHARSSEGNTQGGDQSGNEIREQGYWNYPWNAVLRYPITADIVETPTETHENEPKSKDFSYLHMMYGDGLNAPEKRVEWLQQGLNLHSSEIGIVIGEDGEFGRETEMAVTAFRKVRNIGDSGETDEFFWRELSKFEI